MKAHTLKASFVEGDPEFKALAIMAAVTRSHPDRWRVVPKACAVSGVWYDFADPATGMYGQCRLAPDRTWSQAPRGDAPVVLEWLGGRGAK